MKALEMKFQKRDTLETNDKTPQATRRAKHWIWKWDNSSDDIYGKRTWQPGDSVQKSYAEATEQLYFFKKVKNRDNTSFTVCWILAGFKVHWHFYTCQENSKEDRPISPLDFPQNLYTTFLQHSNDDATPCNSQGQKEKSSNLKQTHNKRKK